MLLLPAVSANASASAETAADAATARVQERLAGPIGVDPTEKGPEAPLLQQVANMMPLPHTRLKLLLL